MRNKVVLIDSGVDTSHPKLTGANISGISLFINDFGEIETVKQFDDEVGHGTAIASILYRLIPDIELYVVKVFNNENIDEELLIAGLTHVRDNYVAINPSVIHLSCGIVSPFHRRKLQSICKELSSKGCEIVAAFDNFGAISYPAAFDFVIGVDFSMRCCKVKEYEWVENSMINLRAMGVNQRLPWLNHSYENVAGASFAAPYITAKVISIMDKNDTISHDELMSRLKQEATYVFEHARQHNEKSNMLPWNIHRAIALPFNKEVHALVRYSDSLNFELDGVYDIKYMGNVGKEVKMLLPNYNNGKKLFVKDINEIDWNADFDTVILGHTKEIAQYMGVDIPKVIADRCRENGKKLFSFSDIRSTVGNDDYFDDESFYYPAFTKGNMPEYNLEKLFQHSHPIVGIVGTGNKQGKFSLQIELRQEFSKMGYKVANMSTEPSGPLFGMEGVFPIGFETTVEVKGSDAVRAVNRIIDVIDKEDPDIIFVGTQAISIPLKSGNMMSLPISQHEVLLGSQPDAYILVVSIEDEPEYVRHTINYLESLFEAKVLALVVYPQVHEDKWSVIGNRFKLVEQEELSDFVEQLRLRFDLPVFVLGKETDKLTNICIDYFSEV